MRGPIVIAVNRQAGDFLRGVAIRETRHLHTSRSVRESLCKRSTWWRRTRKRAARCGRYAR